MTPIESQAVHAFAVIPTIVEFPAIATLVKARFMAIGFTEAEVDDMMTTISTESLPFSLISDQLLRCKVILAYLDVVKTVTPYPKTLAKPMIQEIVPLLDFHHIELPDLLYQSMVLCQQT